MDKEINDALIEIYIISMREKIYRNNEDKNTLIFDKDASILYYKNNLLRESVNKFRNKIKCKLEKEHIQ